MAFTLALPCSAAFLFHDPNGTALVDLEIDGHRETWPIRSVRMAGRPPLVRFRRAAGMLSLPITHRGGSIEALAAFHLVIAGEQGSAKTVLTKILRALIDPNAAPTRAPPREERDLNNAHILAFDNLSSLPSWLSDALCRLASGGSFAIRQLYTDCVAGHFASSRDVDMR
jgi:hypothetical protein